MKLMLQADSVHFDDVLTQDTPKTERGNYLQNFIQIFSLAKKRSMQMSISSRNGFLLSFNRIKMTCKDCNMVTFTSCAFFCRSCRQHKWLLLNVHAADSLSLTWCDQGLDCYYTSREHLPVAGRPNAPVAFVKCVGMVSKGILKKGMCDLYKFCV